MEENAPQTSGSRWEPSPTDTSDPAEPTTTVVPTGPAADEAAPDADSTPARRPRWRHRVVLGAAAAGLVLVGGVTGFAVGHVTADEDGRPDFDSEQFGQRGTPPDFDGDGGPGMPPDGQGFPDQGSQDDQSGQTSPDTGDADGSGTGSTGT